jgi:antimicrobial peptide system SdpB family protein
MGVARSADGHAVQGDPRDGDLLSQLAAAAGRWARPHLAVPPWSSGIGLARTLLAVGSAATLAATRPAALFAGSATGGTCADIRAAGLFCALPAGGGELARWCGVLILLVVASGWRPRLTAVPHWYVSWSLLSNAAVPDGGDQLTAVVTLLLIPVGVTDPRRWHWHRPPGGHDPGGGAGRAAARTALLLIQLQVAVVYFQSSVAKLGVREWADGTAMFYFFRHPLFGSPPWLRSLTDAATASPLGVAVVTWSPLVIEFALGLAILFRPRARRILLVVGIAFHGVIAVSMGLVSFGLAMSGALLLYLLPVGHHVTLRKDHSDVGQATDVRRPQPAR